MKRATVIIGAGFGDEGKGVLTDYFAAKHEKSTVVRFSAGANAGHTVVTPDGRRHVFHHFGSGTLAGAHTYLSVDFIVNPLLWRKEARELKALGIDLTDKFAVARSCFVTTPWDMLVNQAIESHRSHGRHGSCGVGIYETINRDADGLWLDVAGLWDAPKIDVEKFRKYSRERLSMLGISMLPQMHEIFESQQLADDFQSASYDFCGAAHIVPNASFDTADVIHGHMIFEGAQGLLLDQNRKDFFPHLTPSNTGLHNVALLAPQLGITNLDVVYVTRAYATRHGAGPLPHEDPSMSFPDPTNAPNDFQGSLRFALLDLDLIGAAIRDDWNIIGSSKAPSDPASTHRYSLAITCLDQVPEDVEVYVGERKRRGRKLLIQRAAEHITPFLTLGWGPTREDIR